MANLSFAQYVGTGTNKTFSVPFPYLAREHIKVKVNGNPVTFTWIDNQTIQTDAAPPKDSVVDVRRETPRDTRMVDFVDGSVLTEGDLDLSAIQTFYIVQEAVDIAGGTLGIKADGSYDALLRRIGNLGDPVEPGDAISKGYHDGVFIPQMNAIKDATAQERIASQTARSGSEAARDASIAARNEAETFKNAAKGSQDAAKQSETNAATSANASAAYRDTAQKWAENPTDAVIPGTNGYSAKHYSDKAAGSAQSAASSANTANTHRVAAETARTGAETAKAGADTAKQGADAAKAGADAARDTAQSYRDTAQKWAENPEDTPVSGGLFSAKHWAAKAQRWAASLNLPSLIAGAYMRAKADLSGWEMRTPAQMLSDIGAAPSSHNHDGVYAPASHSHSNYLPTSGGSVSNSISVKNGGTGMVTLQSGTSQNPGFVEFHSADGTRRGYIGWQPSINRLGLVSENGWNWYISGHLYTTTGIEAEDSLKANRSIHLRGRDNAGWMWTSYMESDSAYKLYWSNEAAPSQNGNKFFVDYKGHVWTAMYGYLHNYFLPRGGVNYNGDGTVQIGGLKVGGDGNIYMNWAGNWLSNLIYSKINDQENCTGVGISGGVKIYANRRDGGGIVWAARSLTSNDVCLYWNGSNLHFNIDGATGWRMFYDNVNFSDARIKKDVRSLGDGLEVLKKLRPVTYQYNPKKTPVGLGDQNLGTRIGFIAQEVEEVLPEAVRDVPVPYDPEGVFKKTVDGEEVVIRKEDFGETIKTIQSEQIIPVLVKAIQELSARVEALEAKAA